MVKLPKKKPTKNLVTVGAHVPLSTKMTLQAMADAQDISLYKLLQDILEEVSSEFEESINALKKNESSSEPLEASDDGEDLLS